MSPLNENAQKWVDALRSGEYTQARYVLSDGSGYCCLGVACEVAITAGLDVPKKPVNGDRAVSYVQSTNYLPKRVAEWLGMKSLRGKFGRKPEQSLSWINDNQGADFDRIADLIEAHADELGVAA